MSSRTPSSEHRPYLTLVAAMLGWMFDGLEMGLFPLIARPALQGMDDAGALADEEFIGRWMGVITALFLLGAAAGGGLFGWLGDRFGRRRAMSLSILTYSAFTGLMYFAETPGHLGALRFLAALGMGGEWALGVALVMEVWPERRRALLAGLIAAAGHFGFVVIAVVGMVHAVTAASWRWVALLGATPALLVFFVRAFVPESPRWRDAVRAAPARPLREIVSSGLLGRTVLATLLTSVTLVGTWGAVTWAPLWADQLTQGRMPEAKAWTQALSALGAVLGGFLGAWLGQRGRRRLVYSLLCLGSLASCAALFRGVTAFGPAFLALHFVVGGITAAFYGWFALYLPELFPTRVRATAQGIAYNGGRVFAALGALQMGALMARFDGSYARAAAVVTLVYVFGLVLIRAAPETHGRPLPD
jgi:MFS family permease